MLYPESFEIGFTKTLLAYECRYLANIEFRNANTKQTIYEDMDILYDTDRFKFIESI